jgi:hypothetical protein
MRLSLLCVAMLTLAACRSESPGTAPRPQPVPQPEPQPEPAPTCEPLEARPTLARPGACDGDWCWANPLPQGRSLSGVFSPAPGVAWIVGEGGALLRAEGRQVTWTTSPTRADLAGIWGSSGTDIWVVGREGTVLHWDGAQWSSVNSPAGSAPLYAVSGVSATSVWAGGAAGLLMHWDGTGWAPVATNIPHDVVDLWAAGPGEVWVAAGLSVLRCTTAGCSSIPTPQLPSPGFHAKGVSGAAPDDVYFLSHTDVVRFNEGSWTTINVGRLGYRLRALYDLKVTGPGEVWVSYDEDYVFGRNQYQTGIRHWSQGTVVGDVLVGAGSNVDGEVHGYLQYFPSYALTLTSGNDIWAVGKGGRIRRREGGAEVELLRGTPLRLGSAYSAVGPTVANYLFASIAELPSPGAGGTPEAVVAGGGERLWIAGPGDTWLATTVSPVVPGKLSFDFLLVYRNQGGQVTKVFESSRTNGQSWSPIGIHGSSVSDVWVVDWSGLYRYDGTQWSQVQARSDAGTVYPYTGAVWSFGAEDVWFGGSNGLHHWNGSTMRDFPVPGFSVNALWASWSKDLWAVGAQDGKPRADRWDGSTWTQVPLPTGVDVSSLVHVTGRCPGEVYLVGDRSAVFRWDGEQLHTVPVPIRINMLSAARVGSELWVTGGVPGAFPPVYRDNTPVIIRTPWQRGP